MFRAVHYSFSLEHLTQSVRISKWLCVTEKKKITITRIQKNIIRSNYSIHIHSLSYNKAAAKFVDRRRGLALADDDWLSCENGTRKRKEANCVFDHCCWSLKNGAFRIGVYTKEETHCVCFLT